MNEHPLPSTCMKDVVWKNIAAMRAPCASLDQELDVLRRQRVDLLFVDAEGYDDSVVRAFPFWRALPTRIIFEAVHLCLDRFQSLAHLLHELGYKCVGDGGGGGGGSCNRLQHASTWHLRSRQHGLGRVPAREPHH